MGCDLYLRSLYRIIFHYPAEEGTIFEKMNATVGAHTIGDNRCIKGTIERLGL